MKVGLLHHTGLALARNSLSILPYPYVSILLEIEMQQDNSKGVRSLFKKALDGLFGKSVRGREAEEKLKLFIKWSLFGFFGELLLFLFGVRANKGGWDSRVLVIEPGGIGDVLLATPALRYYRKAFPGKEIYILVTQHGGMKKEIFGDLIDYVLTVDGDKFQYSPWYKLQLINKLRKIGFSRVINSSMGLKDVTSKVIATSLKAETTVGYEGYGVELVNPESDFFKRYAERNIYKKYDKFVRSIDKDFKEKNTHPKCAILHHLAVCAAATGISPFADVSTVFNIDKDSAISAAAKLSKLGHAEGKRYFVFVLACVDPARRWEMEKFVAVAKDAYEKKFEIVVIGTPSQKEFSQTFRDQFKLPFIDTTGELSLLESAAVIKNAYCLITSDTGPVHIAVALGTPSICIPAGAHLYLNSMYGRKYLNRWVFKDVGCLYDDARCYVTVPRGMAAPCVQAVSAADVLKEIDSLSQYLISNPVRKEPFLAQFEI